MDEASINRKIEEQLARSMEEQSLVIKLLLLGAGDSGKTTLRKQMRNLFGTGFSKEMREEFAPVILNLFLSGFVGFSLFLRVYLIPPLSHEQI